MAKFLFAAIPAHGHVNPMLAVAQALIARGHEVLYACHTQFQSVIEKAGIPFAEDFSWGDGTVLYNEVMTEGNSKDLKRIFKQRLGISPDYGGFYDINGGTQQFIALIDRFSPDVCYIDSLFFPGITAAEVRRIPYALSVATPFALPSTEYLPHEKGKRMHPLKRFVIWLLFRRSELSITALLNAVRSKYCLPLLKDFRHPTGVAAYLLYSTCAFEFKRKDLYPQTFYIGPALGKPPGGDDMQFPWHWLDGRPVVYFTMGTMFVDKRRFFQMIKAAKGADWQVVITTGRSLKDVDWGPLPDNVLMRSYVPQLALLQHVSVMVTIGGYGTVGQALASGIPLVVLPPELEHIVTASKVSYRKAGITLRSWAVSAKSIRRAIDTLLHEPSYKAHALTIAEDYARCDAAETGADILTHISMVRKPILRPHGVPPTLYKDEVHSVLSVLSHSSSHQL
ncbi:glycosyltransferase [Chitinophaga rhizophila]|uniref:Glycosyltransferase n=1 Tax=Chitinophaga rhizophila TaxID=2866212 RepID=A0ABS7GKN0_9BACT|nr:nucleotide disphospho-sugar-binding domain-containing protein [Chitinophaga rhizophila]MBW8688270.1 glycosyltransferase [Chitinophaga rhizophila]